MISNRTLIAIRTNKWGAAEHRMLDTLQPHWGDDIAVAFHNRAPDLDLPVRCADLDDARITRMGLRVVRDWGWRCGDYSYYALREDFPDYDYYWLIEPDVFFASPCAGFFNQCANSSADVLGFDTKPIDGRHRFALKIEDVPTQRAIFAITRFSGRAIDWVADKRRTLSALQIKPRFVPNDEVVMFSYTLANPDFTSAKLEDIAPDWFEYSSIDVNPDILLDYVVQAHNGQKAIFHPVQDKDGFISSVADRLSVRGAIMNRLSPSLQHLDAEDRDALAELLAQRLRHTLFN